jgi:hypothetical protein
MGAEAAVPVQPAAEAVEPAPVVEVAPQPEVEPAAEPAAEAEVVEPVMASANGHASDGAKSLGFFA